jgi:hypothetical protein
MRVRDAFELELEEITIEASQAAMDDLWCEVLAGLSGVEKSRFQELRRKALRLAVEEPDEALVAYLRQRINEITEEHNARV